MSFKLGYYDMKILQSNIQLLYIYDNRSKCPKTKVQEINVQD